METKVVRMPPEFEASMDALIELSSLGSRPEFQSIVRFGGTGPLPPEESAHNRRVAHKYRRARVKIIAKHEVFEEYLKPLREEANIITARLTEVTIEIAALEMLRQKKSKTAT